MTTNKAILQFIRHMLSAIVNASLYGHDHPQVERLTSQAFTTLAKLLEECEDFSLTIIENELVIDGVPQEFSLFVDRFVQLMGSRGIGHISVTRGITRQELVDFITAVAQQVESGPDAIRGGHIRLGRIELKADRPGQGDTDGENGSGARPGEGGVFLQSDVSGAQKLIALPDMSATEMSRLTEIYENVKKRKKLKITGVFEMVTGFVNAFRAEGKALLVLAALRDADEYTFTHSTNVCILNLAQAISLGIDGQLLNDIGVAGMLHDIGKLFIPEEIITKSGKLSSEEFRLMRSHPVKGARYLLETPGVPRLAIVNAFEHHLKYDLSGYPPVPSRWNQNLCSQMTTISDIFDALRTKRSYRAPMPLEKIRTMIAEMSGTELHPVLADNFLKILDRLSGSTSPRETIPPAP